MTRIVSVEIMYLIRSEWLTWIVALGLVFTAGGITYTVYWQSYVHHIALPIIFYPLIVIAKLTALIA